MKHEHDANPIVFWSSLVVGGAITLYGLHGLVPALHGITSRQFLQWFVGADLTNDLIVAPAACLTGVVIARLVAAPARAPFRAGVFATAIVLAIAWAPLHGYGHASVEPLNYATAVPTVLVAVWALAGGWFTVSVFQRRRVLRRDSAR